MSLLVTHEEEVTMESRDRGHLSPLHTYIRLTKICSNFKTILYLGKVILNVFSKVIRRTEIATHAFYRPKIRNQKYVNKVAWQSSWR